MANYHLRDMRLSLKARGLLSQILSLPPEWDMTIAGLSKINRECADTISSVIKDLEAAGYVTRYRERRKNGTYAEMVYHIYQKPRHSKPVSEKPIRNNSERVTPNWDISVQLSKELTRKEEKNKELYNNPSICLMGLIRLRHIALLFVKILSMTLWLKGIIKRSLTKLWK